MTKLFTELDAGTITLMSIILVILLFFTLLFSVWKLIKPRPFLKEMLDRTFSWWVIFILYIIFFGINLNLGFLGLTLLSVFALREFFEKFDRNSIPFRVRYLCYIFTIAQFLFAFNQNVTAVMVLIPLVFYLAVTVWSLLFEEVESVAPSIQLTTSAMLICVFGLSHLALVLKLNPIEGFTGSVSSLFLYYIFLTQFNDVLQFLWGTIFGRHRIAPKLSPKKTWEGFIGAVFTTALIAYLLREITPFSQLQSLVIGIVLSVSGYVGDLNISAIKRNLGIKDMGNLIPGHGGLLDRIDSLTFSSSLYFYLVYYWFYL